MKLQNKKILVTGGAGFIGSHLCERLLKLNNEVVSLDNYFTGSEKNHIKGVKYIKGNTKDIFKLLDFTPDIIYHLGEYSRVEQSFEDMRIVYEYNKIGTFEVLEFVRRTGAKLIYAGSSTKFGDGGIARNTSPYAWTKASNTELVINYGNWYGINYAITYFYNVYGPREISTGKYATLIALFKEKMKKNEPLTIVKPGTQKRNFTHIDDIINGLILIGEEGYGDEFGIGSDEAYNIIEVAEMFLDMQIEEAIKKGKVIMLPERRGNRMNAEVVTDKTKALGWKSNKHLKDYIKLLRCNHWNDL
jgi:UDP-glucose 4-epimerase